MDKKNKIKNKKTKFTELYLVNKEQYEKFKTEKKMKICDRPHVTSYMQTIPSNPISWGDTVNTNTVNNMYENVEVRGENTSVNQDIPDEMEVDENIYNDNDIILNDNDNDIILNDDDIQIQNNINDSNDNQQIPQNIVITNDDNVTQQLRNEVDNPPIINFITPKTPQTTRTLVKNKKQIKTFVEDRDKLKKQIENRRKISREMKIENKRRQKTSIDIQNPPLLQDTITSIPQNINLPPPIPNVGLQPTNDNIILNRRVNPSINLPPPIPNAGLQSTNDNIILNRRVIPSSSNVSRNITLSSPRDIALIPPRNITLSSPREVTTIASRNVIPHTSERVTLPALDSEERRHRNDMELLNPTPINIIHTQNRSMQSFSNNSQIQNIPDNFLSNIDIHQPVETPMNNIIRKRRNRENEEIPNALPNTANHQNFTSDTPNSSNNNRGRANNSGSNANSQNQNNSDRRRRIFRNNKVFISGEVNTQSRNSPLVDQILSANPHDPYDVFQISRTARLTYMGVKRKFNALSKKLHPDKEPSPGAHEAFIIMRRAYMQLKREIQINEDIERERGRRDNVNQNPRPQTGFGIKKWKKL
ncbi:DnaJ domain-containing protein [Aeromonas sobria]|uniref:DnaJ domain-containing protein n=1 Tax=Aeromonas sobria TaxID=646 RepID=UPI003F323E1C